MAEPVLIGLIFADRIIEEKSGKKGIIGTFTIFNSSRFPVSFPPWAIYAAATNLMGTHEFAINLVHSETNQVVVGISGKFDAKGPEQTVELCIPILGAIFPASGKYNLTFTIGSDQVGARVLTVNEITGS